MLFCDEGGTKSYVELCHLVKKNQDTRQMREIRCRRIVSMSCLAVERCGRRAGKKVSMRDGRTSNAENVK